MDALLSFQDLDARTTLTRCFARSPLKWLTPRHGGPGVWVYASSFGGGLVDGDDIGMRVEVGPRARALVASQASTKVYAGERGCRQRLDASVAAGGMLAFVPDPLVCYRGARYDQSFSFDLDPHASLALVDVLSAGRIARGERWAFAHYSSRIIVRSGGTCVVDERTRLDPAEGPIGDRFGTVDAFATVVLSGPPLAASASRVARVVDDEPCSGLIESADLVAPQTLVVRIAGAPTERVAERARAHVGAIGEWFGQDPFARKW